MWQYSCVCLWFCMKSTFSFYVCQGLHVPQCLPRYRSSLNVYVILVLGHRALSRDRYVFGIQLIAIKRRWQTFLFCISFYFKCWLCYWIDTWSFEKDWGRKESEWKKVGFCPHNKKAGPQENCNLYHITDQKLKGHRATFIWVWWH